MARKKQTEREKHDPITDELGDQKRKAEFGVAV